MKDDKTTRDIARLEEARRRAEEQLDRRREQINQRFDRMQNRLEHKQGKTSLTQQRIIEAALELLKQDGLANITLRKLATKLDIQAPALYWHFKNKEVLVDYMAEAILDKKFKNIRLREDDERWQDWLIDHMIQLREAMLAYPDGARVVAGAHIYPAITLARSLESGLISLTGAGVELKKARKIITTATTYTFGYVIEEQAIPSEEEMKEYDLEELLGPFPHVAKALEDYERGHTAHEREYLTGLGYIIGGAEIDKN